MQGVVGNTKGTHTQGLAEPVTGCILMLNKMRCDSQHQAAKPGVWGPIVRPTKLPEKREKSDKTTDMRKHGSVARKQLSSVNKLMKYNT